MSITIYRNSEQAYSVAKLGRWFALLTLMFSALWFSGYVLVTDGGSFEKVRLPVITYLQSYTFKYATL